VIIEEEEESKVQTQHQFEKLHSIRNQIRCGVWTSLTSGSREEASRLVILLIVVDYLNSFNGRVLDSSNIEDFTKLSRRSFRCKGMVTWAARFMEMLHKHDESIKGKLDRDDA